MLVHVVFIPFSDKLGPSLAMVPSGLVSDSPVLIDKDTPKLVHVDRVWTQKGMPSASTGSFAKSGACLERADTAHNVRCSSTSGMIPLERA